MQWPTWVWEKWFLLIADIYWENTCPLLIVYNCNSTNINAVLSCPTITFFLLYSYTGVAINDPHWLILYLISKSNGSKDNWYLLMMNYKVSCLKCQDFSNQHTNCFYSFIDIISQVDLPNCKGAEKHRRVHGIFGILYFHNKKGLKEDIHNC